MSGAFRLGPNQYGKAEVRIVKITRDTATHEIEDLNVTSQLRGDFGASHLTGDNRHVVATDTQKNTVYGLAREHGIGSPEAFLLRLGDHFTGAFEWVTGGRWEAESYAWARIAALPAPGSPPPPRAPSAGRGGGGGGAGGGGAPRPPPPPPPTTTRSSARGRRRAPRS